MTKMAPRQDNPFPESNYSLQNRLYPYQSLLNFPYRITLLLDCNFQIFHLPLHPILFQI